MAVPPITRRAGMLCITAAVLIILSQVMRLAGGLLGPDWLTTPAYSLTYTVALLGMAALPLALTAIYTRISPPAYPDQAQPPARSSPSVGAWPGSSGQSGACGLHLSVSLGPLERRHRPN